MFSSQEMTRQNCLTPLGQFVVPTLFFKVHTQSDPAMHTDNSAMDTKHQASADTHFMLLLSRAGTEGTSEGGRERGMGEFSMGESAKDR